MLDRKNHIGPSIKDVNYLFMFSMFLFVVGGEVVQRIKPPSLSYCERMLIITISQIIFVLLPIIIFLYIKKLDIIYTLRINEISFTNAIISSVIMFFAMPIATFVNYIVILILGYFGKLHPPVYFSSENITQLMINLAVIAFLPALFEEIFFRGIILRGYEKIGVAGSIVISSLLFALLHRDLQVLLGTFLLGLVIAYIVYRTNSIFAGMIAHFTNNALAVIMSFLFLKFGNIEQSQNILEQINSRDYLIALMVILIISGFVISILGMIFTGLIFLLNYTTRNINREKITTISFNEIDRHSFWPLIVSFILVLYVFSVQLL